MMASVAKKTGYSWISGKEQSIEQLDKPIQIKNSKDRKQEVKRLEVALERLLLNLGSDQDP